MSQQPFEIGSGMGERQDALPVVNAADDEGMMRLAIAAAGEALKHEDVPVGCVIVGPDGSILARACNRREVDADPTAHAEIVAMRQAAKALGYWRLVDCTLVVTLEPCPMCAGAMINARVKRVVFGCTDPKAGAAGTLFSLLDDARLNHRCAVTGGVLAGECADLLKEFFKSRRG